MFTAMAHYPELDVHYRALCRVEADIVTDPSLLPDKKLSLLAEIIRRRRVQLAAHPSLIPYERFLERYEGTAAFVEQSARLALYGVPPDAIVHDYGWTRFYKAGAALCWLLDAMSPGWQALVEAGASPGDIALDLFPEPTDLSDTDWQAALAAEQTAVSALRAEIAATVAPLDAPDALVIHYPPQGKVFRAFSPNTLQSLGDGRILHRTMFKLLLPSIGHVGADGVAIIDDIAGHRVILPARHAEYDGGALHIAADGIDVSLTHVTRNPDGSYRVQP
jgi:hypothetical protein